MATKKYYLDKRVLKSPTIGGSEANLQNVLDLKEYIQDVVDDNTTDFTSINVDTINESTTAHGVIVDGVLIKDSSVALADGTVSNLSVKIGADANNGLYGISDTQLGIAVEGALVAGANTSGLFTGNIAEQVVDNGVTVDSVLLKDGGVSNAGATIFAGFYPIAAEQALSTSGTPAAVNVTAYHTKLTSTGTGDAVTLAVGSLPGQMKKVTYVAEGAGGDTVILTPSVTTGLATATFNAVGDFVVFIFNGTYWSVIENSGATIA